MQASDYSIRYKVDYNTDCMYLRLMLLRVTDCTISNLLKCKGLIIKQGTDYNVRG